MGREAERLSVCGSAQRHQRRQKVSCKKLFRAWRYSLGKIKLASIFPERGATGSASASAKSNLQVYFQSVALQAALRSRQEQKRTCKYVFRAWRCGLRCRLGKRLNAFNFPELGATALANCHLQVSFQSVALRAARWPWQIVTRRCLSRWALRAFAP